MSWIRRIRDLCSAKYTPYVPGTVIQIQTYGGDFIVRNSVVHPKLFFPDPTLTLNLDSDPDSNPDPACL